MTAPAGSTDDDRAREGGVEEDPGHGVGRAGRHTHVRALAVIAAVIVACDLVTKQIALARLAPGEVVPVLGELLSFRLVFNPGAAFSFATGMTWAFTIIAVGVVAVVARVARRLGSRTWAVALGLLLGGAVGNLLDRLFRPPGFARGHVVDFIDYAGFFVGNVADIAIVVAAVLIGILALRGIGVDGSRGEPDGDPEPGGGGA